MAQAQPGNPLLRRIARLLNVEERETGAVVTGLLLFFLLFAGYFMLRPVRETMGVAGGVDNLQWLFTGTFVATLAALPLFGWLASKVARRRILPWTYGFFVVNLLAFAVGFLVQPDNLWFARTFYIWLSVFNLLSISLAWSVLVDVFAAGQAKACSHGWPARHLGGLPLDPGHVLVEPSSMRDCWFCQRYCWPAAFSPRATCSAGATATRHHARRPNPGTSRWVEIRSRGQRRCSSRLI